MKKKNYLHRKEQGQSLLEFAFFLPIFLGVTYFLMQVSMAINGAVVHQQYSRARLFEMLYNSADYPALRFHADAGDEAWQRFWIGMDREKWGSGDNSDREESFHNPTLVKVGNKAPPGDMDGNNFPPERRQNVRIRVISFICMPPKLIKPASGSQDLFFTTETNSGAVRTWYAGGFGSHVQFCRD